jgi:exopolysaccharide biosynthesis protein
MKRFRKYFKPFFIIFILLISLFTIFLFTTEHGYKLRVVAAQVILSSQHRGLAKATFLPQEELDNILKNINNPNYINSHNTSLTGDILRSINAGVAYKDTDARLKDLYERMVEERIMKEALNSQNIDRLKEIEEQREKRELEKGKLIIHVDDIKGKESDHFYEGKLMTISNPSNVYLASSKGEQVNKQFGEQIDIIARRENAIGAINASGFLDANGVGNGGSPIGIVIENGKITNTPGGNSAKTYVAGLTEEGLLVTGHYNANELIDLKVKYAAGFKPQLIVNGEKMITSGNGGWGYGPRTAIGQKEDGSILFLVIDGRQTHSIGASIKDIQDILYEEGAVNAMAMDGGSSSILNFQGSNVTSPSSVGGIPRYIPNAWVVSPQSEQEVEIYRNGKMIESYIEN